MKYDKAPLVNVIFAMSWDLRNPSERGAIKFIFEKFRVGVEGSLSSWNAYPIFDGPDNISKELIVFQDESREDLFVELSDFALRVISTDRNYSWESYLNESKLPIKNIWNLLNERIKPDSHSLTLSYTDFIAYDFKNVDIDSFLKETLNFKVDRSFYPFDSHLTNFKNSYSFQNDNIDVQIDMGFGEMDDSTGMIIDTTCEEDLPNNSLDDIFEWMDRSHKICSDTFHSLINENFKAKISKE